MSTPCWTLTPVEESLAATQLKGHISPLLPPRVYNHLLTLPTKFWDTVDRDIFTGKIFRL